MNLKSYFDNFIQVVLKGKGGRWVMFISFSPFIRISKLGQASRWNLGLFFSQPNN